PVASRAPRVEAWGAGRRPGHGAALVLLAMLAAWSGAGQVGFQFDDWNVIVDNPAVHDWETWRRFMPGIRPLLKASYVASWTTGGGHPAAFAWFNVAVHALNALVLLALLRALAPRIGLGAAGARWVPAACALLFALHPAQTEAVTYLSGRSVSLMALFCLAAVLLQAHAAGVRRAPALRLLSAVCFALALAVKEHAWAVPFALLLVERLDPAVSWRRAWLRTLPHWLVLAAMAVVVVQVPGFWRLVGASLDTRPLGVNLLTQVDGVWYLLTRPLLGLVLNIDPDLAVRTRWSAALALKAGVLAWLVWLAARAWRTAPWLGFALAWTFIWLLPTNSVLPRADVANDRQLYLALAGPALVLAGGLARVAPRGVALAVIAIAATCLLAVTASRNRDYASEVALWEATARLSPDKARVWNNLGWSYETAGRVEEARHAYDRALAIDPRDWKARTNRDLLDAAAGAD
ncbi:MAG: tetratricopeptide repeat protein, partial [Betaproteobacteria bacterium]